LTIQSSAGCSSYGGSTSHIDTILLPEGTLIDYDYDAYGNLSKITDSLGNSVNYSYDSAGNRLTEEIRDPQNMLQKSLSYQYDALGRMSKVTNPDTSYAQYGYDSLGNRTSVKDPRGNTTVYQYDALSRLAITLQPGSITTGFTYDGQGNLAAVTDGNTNATSYQSDDMGRVYQTVSPDTGTTTYTYDAAGNLISKSDAKGITALYEYDAENRLTKIDFPSDTDILYAYDTCVNGKGRLCAVTDQSGTTAYEYSAKGQVAKQTVNIFGVPYLTQYAYDMNGNPTSFIYPSGRIVATAYANNQPTGVTSNGASVAGSIIYKPFGGVASFTYGNGLTRTASYDNQYRISAIESAGVQKVSYGFDANGNITAITDLLDPAKNKGYAYDALDRLLGATGPWGSLGWTYDPVGNRLTQTDSVGTATYSYQSGSNRLTGITGAQSAIFSHDANGNTISENSDTFTYNQNQRLIHAAAAQSADYLYNAQGQRAIKTVNGQTTIYHYNQAGQLIAESEAAGSVQAEYLYLSGQPLAKIEGGATFYIHTDHLGTPQLMTDSQGGIVWQIDSRPFGDNPTITGTQSLNLRFPGQYYDAESGLNQNWFRDYNPNLGRYVEADPILQANFLLKGTRVFLVPYYLDKPTLLDAYSYVQNNPIILSDPSGLSSENNSTSGLSCEQDAEAKYKKCLDLYDWNRRGCVASCKMISSVFPSIYRSCWTSCQTADYNATNGCKEYKRRLSERCEKCD
jgi:RHS repeat-associated protein